LTVAAVVLIPHDAAAIVDADGEPAVRRVVHAAWSGGALPVVIVAADADGKIAAALGDLPVTITRPDAGETPGIGWFVHGQRAAIAAVAETTAAMLWPVGYAWVDPETITSLVEAHGSIPAAIVRPAWTDQPGFPILIPSGFADDLAALKGLHGNEAVADLVARGATLRILELGDPGISHDVATSRQDLPEYQGPPQPADPAPEWNAELAATAQPDGA
jgi:CTP:molybdopterin cytidylyltransferase MocA